MSKCIIIGASPNIKTNINIGNNDFVIVCDGGYNYVKENNIKYDLLIGDFDSLGYIPNEKNKICLNPIKDETDTYYAIELAIKKGYKEFDLYGCSGGKIEHTYANIQILYNLLLKGIKAQMIDNDCIIKMIKNEKIELSGNGKVSIFSYLSKAYDVTLKNLKYELSNYTLTNKFPLGISNEFVNEKKAIIEVKKGVLLIIIENK